MGLDSGLDLISALREESSSGVALVLVTGHDGRDVDAAALDAGADDYLVKSELDARELERVLRYATQHQRAKARLGGLVRRDPLTGLYDQKGFEEAIEEGRVRARCSGRPMCLLLLELRPRAEARGLRGRELVEVATRLGRTLRSHDIAGLLDDGRFGLLLEALDDFEEAMFVRDDVVAAVSELRPGPARGVVVRVGVSVAPGPDAHDSARLLAAAARDLQVVEPVRSPVSAPNGLAVSELHSGAAVREAARTGDLGVLYQPILDLESGETVGVEALSDLRGPSGGGWAVREVIEALEARGVILELDLWALETALEQLRGSGIPRVSVNLSPCSLASEGLLPRVAALAETCDLSVELELTESTVEFSLEQARARAEELRKLRVGLALDDFGPRGEGFSRLLSLPVHRAKLDALSLGAVGTERAESFLRSLVTMGAEMGVLLAAKGIERLDEAERLLRLGIREGQGFALAPPLGLSGLRTWKSPGALRGRVNAPI